MGMDNVKIDRINALAHKAKSVGLTEEEKAQLNNISIKEADGSVTNLGDKYGRKKTH